MPITAAEVATHTAINHNLSGQETPSSQLNGKSSSPQPHDDPGPSPAPVFDPSTGNDPIDVGGGDYDVPGSGGAFDGYGDSDFATTLNPDPTNMHFVGKDSVGSLVYAFDDTTNAADGSTQVSEIVVTATANQDLGVVALGINGDIASGLGFSGGIGFYVNLRQHGVTFGVYNSAGVAVGEGASAGISVTVAQNQPTFQGNSVTVTAADGGEVELHGGYTPGDGYSGGGGIGVGLGLIAGASTYTDLHPLLQIP